MMREEAKHRKTVIFVGIKSDNFRLSFLKNLFSLVTLLDDNSDNVWNIFEHFAMKEKKLGTFIFTSFTSLIIIKLIKLYKSHHN